jgi:hypothetical protein
MRSETGVQILPVNCACNQKIGAGVGKFCKLTLQFLNRLMRHKQMVLMAFAAISFFSTYGQSYYYSNSHYESDLLFEIGGGIGGMNCITDIGGSKGKGGMYINDINLKYTQLSTSLHFGIVYKQLVGVRLEGTWGSVKGADSVLKGASNFSSTQRYIRNLNFKSAINEISLIAEFYPLTIWKSEPPTLAPYIMAGLGYFRFNPQINLGGRDIDLRPLSTEGQNFPEHKDREYYNLKQSNVPVGIGLKYELSQRFTLRVEALHRFLFTDYLDDVSVTYIDRSLFTKNLPAIQAAQANAVYDLKRETPPIAGKARGNSDSKDSYMTVSLKVGVTLGREKR